MYEAPNDFRQYLQHTSIVKGGRGRVINERGYKRSSDQDQKNETVKDVNAINNLVQQIKRNLVSSGVQFGSLKLFNGEINLAALREAEQVANKIKNGALRGETIGVIHTLRTKLQSRR